VKRIPVQSSNLAAVGFDSRYSLLEVEFHSGAVYRYFDVPRTIARALMQAESKGSFFNSYIRMHYPFERLSPQAERIESNGGLKSVVGAALELCRNIIGAVL
jgi:hypothetical protein